MAFPCSHQGFMWDGIPNGHITTLAKSNTYTTGSNSQRAILLIHDLTDWTFPNLCLLADHYASTLNATVYVPDFLDDKVPSLPFRKGNISSSNPCARYEAQIFDFARELRRMYRWVGAVGFCYGGWAVFRLGSREHSPPLVDCIVVGHPSFLTRREIDDVGVPVQILAPEFDEWFDEGLKRYCLERIPSFGVGFEWRCFEGVEHGCFIRGDLERIGEWEAAERGKEIVVEWLRSWLGVGNGDVAERLDEVDEFKEIDWCGVWDDKRLAESTSNESVKGDLLRVADDEKENMANDEEMRYQIAEERWSENSSEDYKLHIP